MISGAHTIIDITCNRCGKYDYIDAWDDMTTYEIIDRFRYQLPKWEWVDEDTQYCGDCKDANKTRNSE